jgi:hypothetical protein
MSLQPAADSPWWGINPDTGKSYTAADGQVVTWVCTGGLEPAVLVPFFRANGAPAVPAPPDPAVLAQQAYRQIPIPKPVVHFGPDPSNVAVKVPVWLSIDKTDPAPVTVTAGGVTVTATPALKSVTWLMGEPVDPTSPGVLAAPVTCAGNSLYVTAPQDVSWTTQPPCGYTYHWKSTAERTGGAQKWTVTASATWVISWVSNVGPGGQITAPPADTTAQLRVGEWTTIGVPASK